MSPLPLRQLPAVIAAIVCLANASRAPAAAPADAATLVAKAGAVELTAHDVTGVVAALPDAARRQVLADPAALGQLVRGELMRRLVVEDARASGFEKDPSVLAELERARREALLKGWLAHQAIVPAGFPSEEEVREAYAAAQDRLKADSDYHLAQIFIAVQDGAPPATVTAALRKVAAIEGKLAGGDFAALAKSSSELPEEAAKGGDLGVVTEARLLPEVRAALAGARVGEVVGPIKTARGLHFVKLIERKPAAVAALADIHDAMVAALRRQKAQELEQRYLAVLNAKSPPSVNEIELGKLRGSLVP